jgi:hypothetical protein
LPAGTATFCRAVSFQREQGADVADPKM